MAIALGTALLGSALIGGAASIAGGAANSKAINNASSAQERSTQMSIAAQERARAESNALLSPYNQRGNAAGDQMNALLGLGGGTTGGQDFAAYVNANPDLQAEFQRVGANFGYDPAAYGQYHWSAYGQQEGRQLPGAQQQTAGADPAAAASNAFDIFRNSTGYQFRLDQGNKSLNALNAARGTLDSGAAVKSALQYGQNIGSQEFGNYMGYLGNQQGVGLSAASAGAGVSQNFANALTGINQNNASAQGNLALAKAQNTNDMLGGLSSSFGLGMGALTRWGK
jgi:hypothetical protein